jgi:S-formylglutathione hydrolase FrmB
MKRKHALLSCLLLLIAQSIWAAQVDTVVTYSQSMHKEIKAIVITPKDYSSGKPCPVVYLLHGYGDNYRQWYTQAGDELKEAADQYHMIIVCPDGNVSSWYMDSPVDPAWKYETYVSGELVKWIDQKYATIANRSGRAITGLSMGGHGALYLAFRHQDIYGAAGSMSGGVDLRPFPLKWNLSERLGNYASHPENWEKNSVINLVHLLTPNSLKLIIDCGTEDFFYKVNCNLHEKLLERYIPHDFITRPGAHNWPYWINSINYQLLFMHRYFEGKK